MTGTAKALKIIRDNHITTPKQFAPLMWPDSEGWKRSYNCGYGATQGGMMVFAAGGFLGKLRYKGLIRRAWDDSITLTEKGIALLAQETASEHS